MTHEEAQELRAKHGSIRAAAKAAGISRAAFSTLLRGAVSIGDTVAVADVLGDYDAVGKVLEVVRQIPPGRLRKDDSLRTELGVGTGRWRAIRSSTRVSGHVYQLPSKEYVWGSKPTIAGIPAKLRELLA